ncbi:hypothetical protein B6D60_00860 [candidate division KSB1 bacterium 4484_87]|nr:MAG: hypothetical protein B6D60_00860 [candidate division KSB1 bacterium 4484_87]
MILIVSSCQSQTAKKEYHALVQDIINTRNEYHANFMNADSTEKDALIKNARKYLTDEITNNIFPSWYGTKWDFYGMTRTPQKGKIACGYFVTTILSDIGFNIPRIKWAKSASEIFIKKLALKKDIKRFLNRPISEVEKYLLKAGEGIYLVGLDNHVGFISVKDSTMNFIHSNYYHPEIGVMSESITSENPLHDSRYRVIGKLMSDQMIINWINNIAYDE